MSQVNTIIYPVKATDEASGVFAKIGNSLGGLNQQAKNTFGQSGAIGQFGKVLAGAGAIAGFALIGRQLEATTAKALELRDAFQAGSLSMGELVEQAAKSIPFIGSFVEAGRNIRELFTGEIAAATKELIAFNAEAAKLNTINAKDNATRKLLTDRPKDIAREQALLTAPDDASRAKMQLGFGLQDTVAGITAKRGEFLGNSGERKRQLDELQINERSLHDLRVKLIDDELAARKKADDDARQSKIMGLVQDAREESERINERVRKEAEQRAGLVKRYAEEDRVAGIEGQRDALGNIISDLERKKPRTGATAAAMTDIGRSGVLASMERRSSDPGMSVLKQSKLALDKINDTLKRIEAEAKQRDRMTQLGGNGSIF